MLNYRRRYDKVLVSTRKLKEFSFNYEKCPNRLSSLIIPPSSPGLMNPLAVSFWLKFVYYGPLWCPTNVVV